MLLVAPVIRFGGDPLTAARVISILAAVVLMSQGVIQNLRGFHPVTTVEGATQSIPGGLVVPPIPIISGVTGRVSYTADLQVGGLIAGVGQRMLGGVSKMMADQFFTRMRELLTQTSA